jgi:hypothetical protein
MSKTARQINLGFIKRDRWQRPLIDGEPYTRASSVGKFLEDSSALTLWKLRTVLVGLVADPLAIDEVRMLTADDKQALNRIAEEALERAQASAKARRGTIMHSATEQHDLGFETANLTGETQEFLDAYRRLLADYKLRPLVTELFVANRELKIAGTLDRLLQGPNRALIGDLKSSAVTAPKYSSLSWGAQCAIYANSQPYHAEEGFLSWADLDLPEPDRKVAAILHVPADDPSEAAVWSVDLEQGLAFAQLAMAVKAARSANGVLRKAAQ